MKKIIKIALLAVIQIIICNYYLPAQIWTINYVQKCIGINPMQPVLSNSIIYDDGNRIGINNSNPSQLLDVTGGNIQTDGQLISTAAPGISPLLVSSNTIVPKLNADLIDGKHASSFALINHNHSGMVRGTGIISRIAVWNSSGTISYDSRLFWNSGLKRLGIGTITPLAQLHIASSNSKSSLIIESIIASDNQLELPVAPAIWELANNNGNFELKHENINMLYISSVGNVGIGISSPSAKLEVNGQIKAASLKLSQGACKECILVSDIQGNSSWKNLSELYNEHWTLYGNSLYRVQGNVGIGISPENAKLDIYEEAGTALYVKSLSSSAAQRIVLSNSSAPAFQIENLNKPKLQQVVFSVRADGKTIIDNVLIAKEIEVKPNVWYDKVFKPDYPLMSLDELDEYIKINQHLPDVPSEETVLNNGINLGELNAILIKKIEELTLYIIQLKKQNAAINELLNNTLKSQN